MGRNGLTLQEMAREFGVTMATVKNWRKGHPAFGAATQEGRDLADARVEDSLYQRAVGVHAKVKAFDKKGDLVEIDLYEKPDVVACIFWLKNRRPKQWRDAPKNEYHDVGVVDDWLAGLK